VGFPTRRAFSMTWRCSGEASISSASGPQDRAAGDGTVILGDVFLSVFVVMIISVLWLDTILLKLAWWFGSMNE